ncbi:hypothetical protein IFM89_001992 [Coptis chinensis]|uniref:Uncharacterized protein n=1 Tax=Coptis chinensis TaxID=261450 RepID=A0A835HKF4_9MAGN|nr:hypothetical protein IFM89_001992 [Coptis chinensis]
MITALAPSNMKIKVVAPPDFRQLLSSSSLSILTNAFAVKVIGKITKNGSTTKPSIIGRVSKIWLYLSLQQDLRAEYSPFKYETWITRNHCIDHVEMT